MRKWVNADAPCYSGASVMRYLRAISTAALALNLLGCQMWKAPQGHGPQWIERPAKALVEALGTPDKQVRPPPPSLSVVYLYGVGAVPGASVCEHDYYVRGMTVVGYSEHGSDPACNRSDGNTQ